MSIVTTKDLRFSFLARAYACAAPIEFYSDKSVCALVFRAGLCYDLFIPKFVNLTEVF